MKAHGSPPPPYCFSVKPLHPFTSLCLCGFWETGSFTTPSPSPSPSFFREKRLNMTEKKIGHFKKSKAYFLKSKAYFFESKPDFSGKIPKSGNAVW